MLKCFQFRLKPLTVYKQSIRVITEDGKMVKTCAFKEQSSVVCPYYILRVQKYTSQCIQFDLNYVNIIRGKFFRSGIILILRITNC